MNKNIERKMLKLWHNKLGEKEPQKKSLSLFSIGHVLCNMMPTLKFDQCICFLCQYHNIFSSLTLLHLWDWRYDTFCSSFIIPNCFTILDVVVCKKNAPEGSGMIRRYNLIEVGVALLKKCVPVGMGFKVSPAQASLIVTLRWLPDACWI